ncbi:peptidoglycan amidohydrolase family protein [Melissococcus plutonius]|uniref:peptidoglycan amidohydrolase family protein n=1 Tax=Melissococcus plutonius TaxID=33970 RepID=UPI003C2F828E
MADINKMIQWMEDRKGKVTYSMEHRYGPNSYDCSSAVYYSLIAGGFLPQQNIIGNTEGLFGDLERHGWQQLKASNGYFDTHRGDIFIWGNRGASACSSGHTGIFVDNDNIIHCNYGYNGITVNNHDTIWGYNGKPTINIYRYGGGGSTPPKPNPSTNDVDYMRKYGQVRWNHKVIKVDDRTRFQGVLQVISNELSGLTPSNHTTDTEWLNNGVPMAGISWADGTPSSSTEGKTFRFDQDLMNIVDYDVPSNGIAVMVAGYKVWVDASFARKA